MNRLKDKIALITGATSGIGYASAKLFAEEGAFVIIIGRNDDKGNKIQNEIIKNGGKAEYVKCDVTDESQINSLREYVISCHGKLDILFNNAGILLMDRLENINTQDWHKSFEVNVNSYMYMARAFIDILCNN